jgi:hypothetical protein
LISQWDASQRICVWGTRSEQDDDNTVRRIAGQNPLQKLSEWKSSGEAEWVLRECCNSGFIDPEGKVMKAIEGSASPYDLFEE